MATADGEPVTEIVYVDTSEVNGTVSNLEYLPGEAPVEGVTTTSKSEYYG